MLVWASSSIKHIAYILFLASLCLYISPDILALARYLEDECINTVLLDCTMLG
jgi:hypothetical protein